jgi:hypothetical protein
MDYKEVVNYKAIIEGQIKMLKELTEKMQNEMTYFDEADVRGIAETPINKDSYIGIEIIKQRDYLVKTDIERRKELAEIKKMVAEIATKLE